MKHLFAIILFLCSANLFAQEIKYDGNGPKTGFKVFVEGGYTQGIGLYGEERVSLMASAGYYFNSHILLGIGSGENYYTESKKYGIPLYCVFRANLLNNSISPFLDIKGGYSIGDIKGLFLAPSIGARWMIGDVIAFTTSIGYELQRTDCITAIIDLNNSNNINVNQNKKNLGALSVKVGFEF